ncbi:Crp/Fnr family transcriptional regulator [Thermophagus xiamenensis]|uniref:cAMP-binding domain of CRP or a regulatory subunit of cAMP-dependent protein kinases n=1 Tax=Thermophagus xiamenensis TaxID=385682 RepID=A0A1I2EG15_9BACT|nr:Crp/Fnr family transcriptional regulator [Thermophagus xiamenensis]SFE91669.1 cAMP-binding domain of CRP or a regulatory subunit of cAMP-dependent protein kinases [Thermophagus xiamenensis]
MSDFKIFKNWLTQVSFLTEKDCSLFEPFLKTKQLKAKDYFLTEGKICHEIGFINQGCFRTYYLADGKEINTHFAFENEFVTDYDSFLQEKPSKYFIQALENAKIVTFNLPALQNAYNQSQNWERFGRMIAEQSYKLTTQRVESFLFLDGEQRYLDLLKNQPHILDRIPLYHIASYLGLERESLSRLRKKIAGK